MVQKLLASFLLFVPITLQEMAWTKYVVKKFDDGTPKVVVYIEDNTQERVKEEVYFSNGQVDYIGHYKGGVEHGNWTYYWPNGQMKSKEFYVKGREDGVMYDYDESGKPITEYTYKKGNLISEKDLTK